MRISKHKIALAVTDLICIFTGFSASFWYVFGSGFYQPPHLYPTYFLPSLVTVSLIFLSIFQLNGLYKYQAITNEILQLQSMLRCYMRVLVSFIMLVFFLKTEYIADSRIVVGLGFAFSFVLMVLMRSVLIPRIFSFLVRRRIVMQRALIVGAGIHGSSVCTRIENNPKSYFMVVGFCDDDSAKLGSTVCGKEVFGTSYELERIISAYDIKIIFIAISSINRADLLNMIDRCKATGAAVHVISDLVSKVNDKLEAEEFGGIRTYQVIPRSLGALSMISKRAIDLVGSVLLLFLLLPLFGVIAWAIKRDSRGPVFYKSPVVGKGGREFTAFKFRSMIHGGSSDQLEKEKYEEGKLRHLQFMKEFIKGRVRNAFYIKDESRITRVGRILRRYSLDELPQLINVLRGEMSFVGPRFCSPQECRFYKQWHKRRFMMKPGITGLWQVRGRSGVNYDDMVMLDLYYVENWSLLFDFEILLRTIPVVFRGTGSRIEKPQARAVAFKRPGSHRHATVQTASTGKVH